MIHQLRIHDVRHHQRRVPHPLPRSCRSHHAALGFHIVAMWEAKTDKRTEFVYLLEWPDERTKTSAWMAEDRRWAEIKRATSAQTGVLVGETEDRVLLPTDYPPSTSGECWRQPRVVHAKSRATKQSEANRAPSRDCLASLAITRSVRRMKC